jgi:hypothetical protein
MIQGVGIMGQGLGSVHRFPPLAQVRAKDGAPGLVRWGDA